MRYSYFYSNTRLAILFLLPILVLSFQTATAQFQVGLNFNVAIPQGEFKENVSSTGLGLTGHFGLRIGNSPLYAGVGMGFLVYGSDSRQEPFSPNIPEVRVQVTTTNNILAGNFFMQLNPFTGPMQPYAEGIYGFSYLFTESKIKDLESDEDVISSTNQSDFTSAYGGGFGIKFLLIDGIKVNDEQSYRNPAKLFLDFKVRYFFGGEAEYLKEGSIQRANGNVTYKVSYSETDLLHYNLGVIFQF
ncbi:hypothetical protein L0128_14690 [candidate division KSB1 bacterium]|nr:hypothetical protein [candidate division KSB1 bacterium]